MSLYGLVANYGSSSENESDGEIKRTEQVRATPVELGLNYLVSQAESEAPRKIKKKKRKSEVIENPLRSNKALKSFDNATTSVFYNPFHNDQEAKNAVLEQHVKLSKNPKDVSEINGKRICWNYRKGRCKFGHKCKYAHDSDLIGKDSDLPQMSNQASELYNMQNVNIPIQLETDKKKKRKPGLSEGLIPPKKSRKMYKEVKLKEGLVPQNFDAMKNTTYPCHYKSQ